MADTEGRQTTRMLVDAEAIIDYDLAIMKLFQIKYNNPNFVNQSMMLININQLRWALLNRKDANPISICLIPDVITGENANDICREIYQNDREEIIKLLTFTDTFKFVYMLSKRDFYDITIWCEDKEREDVVRSFDKKIQVLTCPRQEINTDNYDAFLVKDIRDTFFFGKQFQRKHIFVQEYGFNLDYDAKTGQHYPKVEMTMALMMDGNEVSTIGVYDHHDIEPIV